MWGQPGPSAVAAAIRPPLVDPFRRAITYLRVSVTDRCDFRCFYCMSEDMTFLPKRDLLTLEELDVEVFGLPNLGGLNVVIHGLLGEGVAASSRFDPQAKALGEWVRSRHVDIPEDLL